MLAIDQSADTTGRRLRWRGVEVVETARETARATTLVLDVEGWPGHRAGQHVDIRLTAEDDYQRSYSIASPPEAPWLALTVERLDGGEVSPWLAGEDLSRAIASSSVGRSAAISPGPPPWAALYVSWQADRASHP